LFCCWITYQQRFFNLNHFFFFQNTAGVLLFRKQDAT
jgi:hypothetical protein